MRKQQQLPLSRKEKEIQQLQKEVLTARKRWHALKKIENADKITIKELRQKLANLNYDMGNLKQENKNLRTLADNLKTDLAIARKNYNYVKRPEAIREASKKDR